MTDLGPPPASLDELQTPCLLIDLDAVRHNVDTMVGRYLGGRPERWRPHVKTTKVPAVMRVLLEAGVRRFKCATTREAAVLLELTGDEPIDLLLAMALHGRNLQRLAELADARPHHRLAVLTEDPDHAAAVRADHPQLGLFVDLDPGFGRSGLPLADPAALRACAAAAGPALRGLHAYEGHLRGTPDERAAGCREVYEVLLARLGEIDAGSRGLEVVTSGTPAFPFAAAERRLAASGAAHTVSPGTVVYWDDTSEAFAIAGFRFAATVLTTVISRPRADAATCDAGSKAVDAASGDPCARVVGRDDLEVLRPSEEHLPLRWRGGAQPPPAAGSRLRLVPRHVCPTVNLADAAVLLCGGRPVAVQAVAARGHEV